MQSQLKNRVFMEGVGATSIDFTPLPVLEVLCTLALTLFVKKSFQFWRKKIFPEKTANACYRPKLIITYLHGRIQFQNAIFYKNACIVYLFNI